MLGAKRLVLPAYALLLLLPLKFFGQGLPLAPTKLILQSDTPVTLQLAQTISVRTRACRRSSELCSC